MCRSFKFYLQASHIRDSGDLEGYETHLGIPIDIEWPCRRADAFKNSISILVRCGRQLLTCARPVRDGVDLPILQVLPLS